MLKIQVTNYCKMHKKKINLDLLEYITEDL